MTELSFLLDLLFNKKKPREIKEAIIERIRFIEQKPTQPAFAKPNPQLAIPADIANQSPSTIANFMKAQETQPEAPFVATTAATAQALASRQAAINQAMSGKPEAGRTSPKKF